MYTFFGTPCTSTAPMVCSRSRQTLIKDALVSQHSTLEQIPRGAVYHRSAMLSANCSKGQGTFADEFHNNVCSDRVREKME